MALRASLLVLCLGTWAVAFEAQHSEEETSISALGLDDECMSGGPATCATNALQRRAAVEDGSLQSSKASHNWTEEAIWQGSSASSEHGHQSDALVGKTGEATGLHANFVSSLIAYVDDILSPDSSIHGSPFGKRHMMVFMGFAAMGVFVVLFEMYFLQSTLFTDFTRRNESQKETPSTPPEPTANPEDIRNFWSSIQESTEKVVQAGKTDHRDMIGFQKLNFSVFESAGQAKITLVRQGLCQDAVDVRVRTSIEPDIHGSAFSAVPGTDFDLLEAVVRFQEGEQTQILELPIHLTETSWSVTRWFLVELVEVSGKARLGGPMICRWDEDCRLCHRPAARVFILQEDPFPLSFPEECNDRPFMLVAYYVWDRLHTRGSKFFKTLLGLLYNPIHHVVVTGLVQKYTIDWACDWSGAGLSTYHRILFMGAIQLFSLVLTRWGDVLQVKNRGRTGAIRMEHRSQIFEKLLMLEHRELCEVPSSRWFYCALVNVDVMTTAGYWQALILIQSIFALALSLGMLLMRKRAHGGMMVVVLLMLPMSAIWVAKRQERMAELLEVRMDAEQVWVDTLSWAAHAGPCLYSLGPREVAHLQKKFAKESAHFIKHHQTARDANNDGEWISAWLGGIAYVFVLIYGAMQLLAERKSQPDDANLSIGSYVLLLKLMHEFEKYLGKMNSSVVKLQSASVSLQRAKQLLNITEKKSLRPGAPSPACPQNSMELLEVQYLPPSGSMAGDVLGPLKMLPGKTCSVPLNQVVCVSGGAESTRNSFMALLSNVIEPDVGEVRIPGGTWAVMLPAVPSGMPDVSTLEALQFVGAPAQVAKPLLQMLGLPVDAQVNRLPPGQLQIIAVLRGMLRDPAALVMVRPFAFVSREQRPRLESLLHVWQHGGLPLIVQSLLKQTSDDECTPRTLIITHEDVEQSSIFAKSQMQIIELDEFLEKSEA